MLSNSFVLAPPPVETLLYGDTGNLGLWPNEIKNSAELQKQTEARSRLYTALNSVFKRIGNPVIEITDAISSETIAREDATALYRELADFLEEDALNKRFVLYLPFEILPHRQWKFASRALNEAIAEFTYTYMKRWDELLSVNDVRANFLDGNVLEPELRIEPLMRVAKAAHFIPFLVAKDLIPPSLVRDLIDESPGSVLQKSVIDALPVLVDLGFLTAYEAGKIIMASGVHETHEFSLSPAYITPARAQWLAQEKEQKRIALDAKAIAERIVRGHLQPHHFEVSVQKHVMALAIIHGVRIAVETAARAVTEEAAKILYQRYEPILLVLWRQEASAAAKDAVTSAWAHLYHLNIISREYIEQQGVFIPDFDAPFAKNMKLIEEDIGAFKDILERMQSEPELSQLLYPACILFGSRVKGYGTSTADLDVAVFVKPEVSMMEKRPELQKRLKELFTHGNAHGKAVEFWLTEKEGGLEVMCMPRPDTAMGDSMLVHVLFGGAWYGEEHAIRELYDKVLTPYLYAKDEENRRTWLEEMERDTLLYRLLHKGYARFFPEQGGVHTRNAAAIDGQSVFYDSGYRQLAAKLFIKKVFLPRL
ncbi:MAG: nucleotidyltransferase domain-containing protein [Candidatus Sungbacteria bacterium]|nr:nucleotidyltransferase domain-containing protein [Candidatus Sungbacteria bacterium]